MTPFQEHPWFESESLINIKGPSFLIPSFNVHILLVYGVFSDRVGLPLHNIPAPFLSVMGYLFSRSQVLPYPLLHSLTMSFLVFQLAFCLLQIPNSIHFFTQPSSPFLITCPYHPSLPPLITVMIGSNSNQFSQLFTCPSVIHLIIFVSALSNFNPISTSKGLVSLPKVMLLLTQLTYTRLQRRISGCQKWKTPSELHPSISDSSCSSKIRSTISIKSVSQIAKLFTHPYVSPSTN